MEKNAQKRGPLTKLRELINVPGEKAMGLFSPQFVELMNLLREIDDEVRDKATNLKNLIKLAKTNFNRREYMVAVYFLGQFHEQIELINNEFSKLSSAVDAKHHEFLFSDIEPENIDYLVRKLGPKFERPKSSSSRAYISKNASFSDWWYNITSDRGRALSVWEKAFPKQAKELKNQISGMISKSESILDFLLDTLKTLASFRAQRKLEDYLKTSEKFKSKYLSYNSAFATFYNTHIKAFVSAQQALMDKKESTELLKPEQPLKSKFVGEKIEKPITPLPPKKPEDIRFPEHPAKKETPSQELYEIGKQLLQQEPKLEKEPSTEQDIGSTLLSPPLIEKPKSKTRIPTSLLMHLPTHREESVKPEEESLLEHFPTYKEEIEELEKSPTTMRSPASPPIKDKPIQVSKAKLYQNFIEKLNKAADIRDIDSITSDKLLQISNSIEE